ncbi:MAG TPA: radical SAM protein [Polyangiaceae bacterium]|nr:radical SAM protein [Polyangiaceae bacterium]
MTPSRFNIVSRLPDSDRWLVANLLRAEADILDSSEYDALQRGDAAAFPELAVKGYLTDPDEELRLYRKAYADFIDGRDRDEVQLFFVPGYACNFACSYCYQDAYASGVDAQEPEPIVDAFFRYVDQAFAGRKKYVTVFGGEPLLPTPRARRFLELLVEGTSSRGLDLAVVTNGFHVQEYLDLLCRARIREIQITLDGIGAVHDQRRHLAGGQPTFERIVAGIDACLARGLAVNLRVVVDRDNLSRLPELATFAVERGWTRHPLFKTQLGRNYELHHCQASPDRLYSRLELHAELYRLARAHPQLLQFHKPAFSFAKFLTERGELPDPLFDSCPGCKTEWAFDASGRIYPCTATVGKDGEQVGTFHPEVRLERASIECWEERDVTSIAECRECPQQLACGGGCASVAKNRTGRLLAPDCRPVGELAGLGVALYSESEVE